jgi:Flp pilus assembly protein TadG
MLRSFRALLRNCEGNIGLLFGLLLLPIGLVAGSAIDYSGASTLLSSLQVSVDGTTLALCQSPANSTVAELRTRAQTSLNDRFPKDPITIVDLQSSNAPRSVTLTAKATYKTAFMQLANKPTIDVRATARCSASETYFEIALVLDTTGSMASSGKMAAAKTAATNFVNYMFKDGAMPDHVRMSLVPFAASVAIPSAYRSAAWIDTAGKSPLHWRWITSPVSNSTNPATNFTSRLSIFNRLKGAVSSWDWAGCVESPPYPYNVTDGAVSSSTPASLILPLFAPDELSGSYFSQNSYIADGNGTGNRETCRSDDPTSSKRFTQACKYQVRNTAGETAHGPNWQCTSRPLSILGTSQSTLLSEINALQPLGSTNIHEGFMWGWRTISPTSVFGSNTNPPVPYAKTVPQAGQPIYRKIIVLMTDGTNFWDSNPYVNQGSQYSAYGYFKNADGTDATAANSRFVPGRTNLRSAADGRAAIDELLAAACTNAKAKDVVIYTVGFTTPSDPIDEQGLNLLRNCASGDGYAFVSKDATSLISDFEKIWKSIGALRLTR